jgi:hypothetical protein
MDSATCQAVTTELTAGGFRGTAVTTRILWANFYNMVLSTAKMLDSTREKQTGRQQVVNQQRHTPNGTRNTRNTPTTSTPYTNYTGPSMVMRPGMRLKDEDWKRLTAAQQTKMKELAAQKRKLKLQ